jgi:hypothetical protein
VITAGSKWRHLNNDGRDFRILAAYQDGARPRAHSFATLPTRERAEWTHGNAIIELPDGNLLVSFRNISTIIKIDRPSGRVVWKLGPPMLSGQHAPTPLPDGNLLIFDNGPHRLDQTFPFSSVIEINPATNEIVWKYQEAFPPSFYSDRISNAQRLLNDNTLINEGQFGRFFEVTPAGEVV